MDIMSREEKIKIWQIFWWASVFIAYYLTNTLHYGVMIGWIMAVTMLYIKERI